MSRMALAAERLSRSLERLEAEVLPLTEAREKAAESAKKVDVLTLERETLQSRIAELEDDAQVLSGLTEEVEGRLDGAIAEIRAALGR
jgi:hypothetical protein